VRHPVRGVRDDRPALPGERGPHLLIQVCRGARLFGGVMTTAAHHHRPVRLLAAASGGLILVLALAVAASPSSARGAAAGTPAAAGARAAASGGTWGTAEQVPGTAVLNKFGHAEITSVSCAKAGDCSAGGSYADAHGQTQVFVAGEV